MVDLTRVYGTVSQTVARVSSCESVGRKRENLSYTRVWHIAIAQVEEDRETATRNADDNVNMRRLLQPM